MQMLVETMTPAHRQCSACRIGESLGSSSPKLGVQSQILSGVYKLVWNSGAECHKMSWSEDWMVNCCQSKLTSLDLSYSAAGPMRLRAVAMKHACC